VKGKLLLAIVAAGVIGFIQWWGVLDHCWMYIAMYNPVPRWLIVHGVNGIWLRSVLFIHDATINVILCLPAAFVLRCLRPHQRFAYLVIAVLTGFLWEYRMLCVHPDMSPAVDGLFIYGMFATLTMLPAAFMVLGAINGYAHGSRKTPS
jgi:hypothetical protein